MRSYPKARSTALAIVPFGAWPSTPRRSVDAQNSYRHWNPRSDFLDLRRWQIWGSRIAPDSPNNRFDPRPDLRRRCAPSTRKIPIGTGIRALIFSICVVGKFGCRDSLVRDDLQSPLCLEFHGPYPSHRWRTTPAVRPREVTYPRRRRFFRKERIAALRGPEVAQRASGPSCVEAAFRGPRSELASFGKEPPR